MSSGSEPVLLVRVFDPVEAEIIVAKLRGAGITSFVRHEALGGGLRADGGRLRAAGHRRPGFRSARSEGRYGSPSGAG